jgi:hypothetical protein
MRAGRISAAFQLSLGVVLAFASGCTVYTNGARPPGSAAPAATAAPAAAAAAPAPAAAPPPLDGPKVTVDGRQYVTVKAPIAFGNGDNAPGSFKGFVYFLPNTTTQLPNLAALAPVGVLFTTAFQTASSSYVQGFPGLDPARNDYFGIRYEGTFAAAIPGEYLFRSEADDGAKLMVDGAAVLQAATAGARGAVNINPGTHTFKLEYWQAAKGAVKLRLWVTPPGGAEKPFTAAI